MRWGIEDTEVRSAVTRYEPPPLNVPKVTAILMTLIIIFAVVDSWVNLTREATAANEMATRAAEAAQEAQEAADAWHGYYLDSQGEIEHLRASVASLTATVRSLQATLDAEREKNTAVPTEIRDYYDSLPDRGGSDALDRWEVEALLRAACNYYGITGDEADWLVEKGTVIAWRESSWRPHARNGSYIGLFQFGPSWGSEADRLDEQWSCYRFVRAYVDGGEQNLRSHWSQTW